MKRTIRLAVAAVIISTVTISTVVGAPAVAHGRSSAPRISDPIAEGLAGPLGLGVDRNGNMIVAQSFAGTLSRVSRGGSVRDIAFSSDPNASFSGVHVDRRGKVMVTLAGFDSDENDYVGLVQKVGHGGATKTIGDPATHEETTNPDQGNSYGFTTLTPECAAEVPEEIGGDPYPGMIDSNAYAVTRLRNGSIVVADAGGNDLVMIDQRGNASTLAVFPPQPVVVPDEATADAFGLPHCVVGHAFGFEPVPTDVELGRDGMLYVSLLPGGPEDDSAGARGKVVRVDPHDGSITEVASGFLGAVDLAVTPNGTIYVAELFGGRISKVVGSSGETVVELDQPGAIEWARGQLYVTVNVLSFDEETGAPLGAIVKVRP